MNKNDLLLHENTIIRILEIDKLNNKVLIINCSKRTMPFWVDIISISNYTQATDSQLYELTNYSPLDVESLSSTHKKTMYNRFSLIAGIIPIISNGTKRSMMINQISIFYKISKQTIRQYLCLYLIYQNITALAPKQKIRSKEPTQDEKNMRWGLNKFFYNQKKNSLHTAYVLMLREKYCDKYGELIPKYPSFYQFRYYYRKHKKMSTFYISRNGLKNYQRNNRPLLGNGVQQFANHIGIGMLDSTICDIYLINDNGDLVGRPVLTACIDAYSSLCCGYSLSWEGGMYSLRDLMLNIVTDKKEYCEKYGILINVEDWNCQQIPATLITDKGSEYKSYNFEQITELGIKVINLPSYRPELKGSVEKFFDIVQNRFKPDLKGKGVIEPDYQERGSHDYRKDACLTLERFEKIIIRCIIFYNTKRILDNFPYEEGMINNNVKPYANTIWNYSLNQVSTDLISVTSRELILTLLPRTSGKFNRFGLNVNGLRYKNDSYTEMYLKGGSAMVAYNPDDVSFVWLIEKGSYIKFEIIDSRFRDKDLTTTQLLRTKQKQYVSSFSEESLQAQIDLSKHITSISDTQDKKENVNLKSIRETRKKEQAKTHKNFVNEENLNDE